MRKGTADDLNYLFLRNPHRRDDLSCSCDIDRESVFKP